MSDNTTTEIEQPGDDERRRRGWAIFDRWGNLALVLFLVIGVGTTTWALGRGGTGETIYVEAADAVGLDPFTTAAIAPTTPTTKPALYGGSGDPGVCDVDKLISFLLAHPDKATAWRGALNKDTTLIWSGGNTIGANQIADYLRELTATHLTHDTKVLNHGYNPKTGKATPRLSILKTGTAVLVDSKGTPRVRCQCGNPLDDEGDDETPPPVPSPSVSPSVSSSPSASPSPSPSVAVPVDCNSAAPVPPGATNITTAPVDYNGDGVPDVLRVYELGGVWHVQAEIAGVIIDDQVLAGIGPMTAIGGASVNNDQYEEAWVKTGTSSSGDIIGLLVFQHCGLERVELNGSPADFPVGYTATHADGVACFGFNTGIVVYTTTSTDGVNYKGTGTIYTLDLTTNPPSLVLGAVSNENENTSSPAFNQLHTFLCDNLNTIP